MSDIRSPLLPTYRSGFGGYCSGSYTAAPRDVDVRD